MCETAGAMTMEWLDWLSPENVLAALGVLGTVGVLAYERLMPGLKRIGYRVQMDTLIGGDAQNGQADVRLGLFGEAPEMSDASLVLLRIENDGLRAVGTEDYTSRELSGLTVTFTERTVTGVAVTEPSSPHLMSHFSPRAGLRHDSNVIHVPKVPLNRGESYKLLVLLTGSGVGRSVTVNGGLREGAVKRNRRQPRPSNRVLGLVAFLALLLVAEPVVLTLGDRTLPPVGCAEGALTVTGSTAFAPVLEEVGTAYEKECAGATVTVDARGTGTGLWALDEAGKKAKGGAPAHVTLSDGAKPDSFPKLRERYVAVSVFTLVVNERARVKDLSLEEVRRIYRGDIVNWKEVGGADLPVRLVSRDADSGTREVFQRRVLDGNEPPHTARDCVHKDDPGARVTRCELNSTERVLSTVADVPGALGYSELRAADQLKGMRRVSLDGRAPSPESVAEKRYPYHETEYAYTYGQPPADSLASSFLDFLINGSGQNIVATHGHLPCAAPPNMELCRRS
ncbi:substrate-binding domain-containing protein [Streptomyces sp. NPDC054796]